MAKASKLIALGLSIAFAGSCAWEPVPNAFKGLNEAEMAAAFSDTTTVYVRPYEMNVEYLGSDGQYREWSSSRKVLISGKWSRVDDKVCQYIPDPTSDYIAKYCKGMSGKIEYVALVFSGDALHMVGRKNVFCKMSNPTYYGWNSIRIDNTTIVSTIVAAAALRNREEKTNSEILCNDFVLKNQDSWFIDKKYRASKLKKLIKYSNNNGEFFDMGKFENIAPNHLTKSGIVVFRNYFQIMNNLTKKSRRSRKFF